MTGNAPRTLALLLGGAVGALVLAVLCCCAAPNLTQWGGSAAASDDSYNRLVAGFRAGQLSLRQEVPPGLARLADPYDPVANQKYQHRPYRLHDLSYYRGRLYLYFGVTPALLLFWPWAALTGHFLYHWEAVAVFCGAGFAAGALLLYGIWRRYFPEVGAAVMAAGVLALGLATGLPILLQRAEIWEVPIACGYALTMFALGALWQAWHRPAARGWWLGAASVALGLAVGARPILILGAPVLLVPLAQGGWRLPRWLLCAAVPLALVGAGLMAYNALRFGSPFEFGQRYQLAGDRQDTGLLFSPRYLWFNFRVYFLEPTAWSPHFPFVVPPDPPTPPAGHALPEDPFGVLANLPVLWFALAAPLAWRRRAPEARGILRGLVAATAILGGSSALILCLFYGNCSRYEVEFLPALVLLAVVGLFSVERLLAGRPGLRRAFRAEWVLFLAVSVGFNLLTAIEHFAEHSLWLGNQYAAAGQPADAIPRYQAALRASPALPGAENALANALLQTGHRDAAIAHYKNALQLDPASAPAHDNLGVALLGAGQWPAAAEQFREVLRIKPDDANADTGLGNALMALGRPAEAVGPFQEAARLGPNQAAAEYNLGNALAQSGRPFAAADHYRASLRLGPGNAAAHYNLGNVLRQLGLEEEAREQYGLAQALHPANQ